MKKQKKKAAAILGLTLVLGLSAALAGCGQGNDHGDTDPQKSSVHAENSEEENVKNEEDSAQGSISEAPQKEPFTMVFTGDVLFQDNILAAYNSGGLSGILSNDMQRELKEADIAMVNEEFPFGVGGTKAPDKQFTFKADPSYVKVFQEMGVDMVSLANNHVLDFGPEVLSQTFDTLEEAKIPYVGAGESVERASAWETIEVNGTKVAFLCASRVIPVVGWDVLNSQPGVFTTYDPSRLAEQIRKAKQENDLVVVYVHWGIEKAERPEAYQRDMARTYIDAGADLVVGSHPHVLQGIEYYKDVPIVYSLGNFLFHPTIDRTAVLKVTVDEKGQLALTMIPAKASASNTYVADGEAGNKILSYLESISYDVDIDEQGVVTPKKE